MTLLMVDVYNLYLIPPTPTPVPLLLACGLVESFRLKFLHAWKFIYASFLNNAASVWSLNFLYLHAIICTDARGTFSCLKIAPKEDVDLQRPTNIFFLAELHGFSHCIKANKALRLKAGPSIQPQKHSQLTLNYDHQSIHQFLESSGLFRDSQLAVCKILNNWNSDILN